MEAMEHVDIIVGSDGKSQLADMIEHALIHRDKQIMLHDVRQVKAFEALPIHKFEHQTRAFLKIQDGCNQFAAIVSFPMHVVLSVLKGRRSITVLLTDLG